MTDRRLEHDWWPCPVPDNVELAPSTWLWSSYVFLHYRSQRACGVRIGPHSGVYAGTGFDLGPRGMVEIGAYCTVVAPIFATNGRVEIGDHAFIANQVVFADTHAAAPPSEHAGPACPPTITVGDTVWIGARAVILAGASLGDGAVVGAGAVVDFAVEDHTVVAGNPARVVGSALGSSHAVTLATADGAHP